MSGLWRVPLFDREMTMIVDCTGGACHVTEQHIDRLT